MNRHQSNPFLSDWGDDSPATLPPPNAHSIFDTDTNGDLADDQLNSSSNTKTRRSSCSQVNSDSGVTTTAPNQSGRSNLSLYRRNMSSFEAASSLEQHFSSAGKVTDDLQHQRELIAKMTADFQSAIETNDKQFDALDSFNPFDPFETIVDDDSLPLASPAPTYSDRPQDMGLDGENRTARAHDSIDDDDEELVSTPVRNIKSPPSPQKAHGPGNGNPSATERQHQDTSPMQQIDNDGVDETSTVAANGNDVIAQKSADSIAKATLFASLLASAENAPACQDSEATTGETLDGLDEEDDEQARQLTSGSATRVIKGSPTSGDERPVGFFDPFETVIDKDALSSLMSENQKSNSETAAAAGNVQARSGRVAESVSIETVIENKPSSASLSEAENVAQASEPQQQPPQPEEGSGKDVRLQYDSAIALGRPAASKLVARSQPASGYAAPKPTPSKRALKSAAARKPRVQRRGEQDSDSSSSSDTDEDRFQIVIKARAEVAAAETAAAAASGQQAAASFVPLLPPPPSRSSMKQARERGQVEDMPSPIMSYKNRQAQSDEAQVREAHDSDNGQVAPGGESAAAVELHEEAKNVDLGEEEEEGGAENEGGQFVIPMTLSDNEDGEYARPETPLYDEDTSYVLEEFPPKHDGSNWEMMLRYPPKKKLTANRFWKKIFVKLAQVPLAPEKSTTAATTTTAGGAAPPAGHCWALQIFEHQEDKKPMQEIPIQATYTVSEISSQLFDQFGKIFTIKLQYIFYKERVGVRQGQLARFIHTGHIGSSTTSGGHGVDPISIGAIKRMGAPIEHSPQISQIIKLGCASYERIKSFKEALEDCLFRMPIQRNGALSTYKTEEVQMAVRDETYIEVNQIGTVTKQLARVRLFFLSFLNGTPTIEVGINDIHRQGREVVGRMDILPVVTEEWIRLEAWELHSTVDRDEFERVGSRLVKLTPPDATFFELMRFRVRPPRNRELPLQISANMSVTRTRVSINCEVMVPGCVSRKHGQIPCENIAIRFHIPECWIYFFREEKHFRMGSKKSVNRRPGKVKGIERFLGGGGAAGLPELDGESSLIEVTSGQAKYEHHHGGVVWRAARWPKESQSAYVQNTMKIRLPLTAYDKMPESFYEYVHVEYTMPATTVSHTTLRSISVNPCADEPAEKYVKYAAKYECKVKMRLSVNLGNRRPSQDADRPEASPIVIMKRTPGAGANSDADIEREKEPEVDDDDEDDDDDDDGDDGKDIGHDRGAQGGAARATS